VGYGESKLVSECLLGKAATICGVRSATCRVGIVAGPVEKRQGAWNRHEYIPSVSSLLLYYILVLEKDRGC
jgi:thioester reductase-like protein